ncbi:hypothetical protein Tsubulata_035305 [Turnera subulata]|uniref:Proteasome alpha-type subunits domain-containing protein n=1 Tax=Turnera subulata TaxID=218843 RepID=A0A9Q0F6N3_9ROSI|nr:hypothetical protein Tsubulata_035305 [Turnera subulata]
MGDSQYSFSLTTFSPSGKLVQIEHALTAVGSGQTSLGIKAANGVVIATEKKLPSNLVDESSVQKIQCLTPNIGVVYSGMGPDFRVLVRKSRKQAEQYHRLYKEAIPVTQLVRETAAVMQEFTQSGGVRPFGVSLLVAGYDDKGPQLYQVDPSGSYFSWKASAMGKNVSNAKTFLEKRYTDDMELDDAVHTAILTLKEGFEGQISGKNIEIGIIGADKKFRVLTPAEIDDYLAEVELIFRCTVTRIFIAQRSYKTDYICRAKSSGPDGIEKYKHTGLYIDKRGKWRSFDRKKLSRERCGTLRGKGWKYGSGFVDGIFPVLSPIAQKILQFVQKEVDPNTVWGALDTLPPTHATWDDLINVAVQLRLNKKWDPIVLHLLQWLCAVVYNAYIDGLMKNGNSKRAIEIFNRMKRDSCQPSTETYTLLINLHGKASQSYMAMKLFNEMRSQKCKPNICTYTALVNAFARQGLCEKAEEIFEQLQEAGHEPDVYAYNALMEAYSRAGFPSGAAEIFSLMQHMGCEPDRASYNILVDAYGRAGLHEDAQAVFEEMKRLGITPTMKSHMLLLSAYSKARNVAKCEEIVNQMSENGLEPDTFVLNSMLNLYGRLGQFEKMEEVLAGMEKGPYEADISTFNILINVYGRAGFLDRMEGVFQSLATRNLKPDVVTWTSRLGAYSRKKLYTRCLEIFEEMIDAGCYPDGGTAKVLLSACSSEDQIEQVTTVIRTMHKDMKTVLPV